jgi:hypothetical protein
VETGKSGAPLLTEVRRTRAAKKLLEEREPSDVRCCLTCRHYSVEDGYCLGKRRPECIVRPEETACDNWRLYKGEKR